MMIPKSRIVLALALAVAATAAGAAPAAVPPVEAPTLAGLATAPFRTTVLNRIAARRLRAASWSGGAYTTSSGERVVVYVSTAYGADESVGRRWADYFASLPHGSELGGLRAYVAPLDDVAELCGAYALGCYGDSELVTIGDSSAGTPPASVAAHEYGHHVAANRDNAPWPALDWGTKRWATYANICGRERAADVFPGNEGPMYELNPGEAFAESYRVLVETGGTALGYAWPIVDDSFRPDARALELVREDVLHPWAAPSPTRIQARFHGKSRAWATTIATPLDGALRIELTVPNGGVDDAVLSSGTSRPVTAVWDAPGRKSLTYRVCGARSVKLRVTRGGAVARFALRVAAP
jgi:hypothetical protein